MCVGYLVNGGPVTEADGIFNAYMEARERLFGYPKQPAQLLIPVPAGDTHPTYELRNAPPGLVATQSQAAQLRDEMARLYPSRTWVVEPRNFSDAVEIQW
jgi:hypothetical protein